MNRSYRDGYGKRFIPRGTLLVCPKCGTPSAIVTVDVWPDETFDFRAIAPLDRDGVSGISSCCLSRYVTFEGMYYTEDGAV
jgi:hypothetical protein